MTRGRWPLAVPVALALGVMLMGADAAPRIGAAPLYALGVVTPNLEETARRYETVLGVKPAMMGETSIVEPDGQPVKAKMWVFPFANFYIKVFEPLGANGPYAEHLRKYGLSVQDSQFFVEEDIRRLRAELQRKGGRWTLGSPSDPWAYVDFQEKLGTTLEPINMGRRDLPIILAPGATTPALASMPVTAVGVAVSDIHEAAKAYGEVFGIPTPAVNDEVGVQFAPGRPWSKAARVEVARWRQGEVEFELIGSSGGPTPWSNFVEKHQGNAVHHITIDVGDHMDEMVRELEAKGGKLLYERRGGAAVDLDFTDILGFVIEIEGKRAPRRRG